MVSSLYVPFFWLHSLQFTSVIYKLTIWKFNWKLKAIEINSYEAHLNELMLNDTQSKKVEVHANLTINLQAAKVECESLGKEIQVSNMCPMNWNPPICYRPTGMVAFWIVFWRYSLAYIPFSNNFSYFVVSQSELLDTKLYSFQSFDPCHTKSALVQDIILIA